MHIRVCKYMHLQTHTLRGGGFHPRAQEYAHALTYTSMYFTRHIYVHTYKHTYALTYIHTNIHTYTCILHKSMIVQVTFIQ